MGLLDVDPNKNPILQAMDRENTESELKSIQAHDEVLEQLLQAIEKVDFQAQVFPKSVKVKEQIIEIEKQLFNNDGEQDLKKESDLSGKLIKLEKALKNYKLHEKHYLIKTIININITARKLHWGLCKNNAFIYIYNGCSWSVMDKESFERFLGMAAERMGVPAFDAKYYFFKEKLFKQFMSDSYLPKPQRNSDLVLVNLQNGTFEITPEKQELRDFNRNDFLTYQLPFNYKKTAKAPLFEKFLNEVIPDVDCQRILAEYLGYLFISNKRMKLEKVLVLYGSGSNGKSVFFEIVSALVGEENISNYSIQQLTDENGQYRADISNKLVNYASEINGNLKADVFKAMVSGEPITGRMLYKEPINIRDYAKLIFNCNELPKEVEQTEGYFRRWLIIPFNQFIAPEKRDYQLAQKIIDNELSGVFNWVLDGLNRLLEQNKFTHSNLVDGALEEYRIESDSVRSFVHDEGYYSDNFNQMSLADVYCFYEAYCKSSGLRPVSNKKLKKRLQGLGIGNGRDGNGNYLLINKKAA